MILILGFFITYSVLFILNLIWFVYKATKTNGFISVSNYPDFRIVPYLEGFKIQLKQPSLLLPFFNLYEDYQTSEGRLKNLQLAYIKQGNLGLLNPNIFYKTKLFKTKQDALDYISNKLKK